MPSPGNQPPYITTRLHVRSPNIFMSYIPTLDPMFNVSSLFGRRMGMRR